MLKVRKAYTFAWTQDDDNIFVGNIKWNLN